VCAWLGRVVARLTVGSWGAVINQVLALGEYLVVQQVRLAVMEAIGDCWKPFYSLGNAPVRGDCGQRPLC
jgi:transposase